jgi:hypothetical protein
MERPEDGGGYVPYCCRSSGQLNQHQQEGKKNPSPSELMNVAEPLILMRLFRLPGKDLTQIRLPQVLFLTQAPPGYLICQNFSNLKKLLNFY